MKHTIYSRAQAAAKRMFRQHVLRDPFLREVARWRADDGDHRLRLQYPLNEQSVIWDLGGYHGDFAADISNRYGCKVFLFEPVPKLYKRCVERFRKQPSIVCLPYGLGSSNGEFDITDDADASSFVRQKTGTSTMKARIRALPEVWRELGTERVDLIKVNIEGGEYDVLPSLLDSGLVRHVDHLQVQFHNFIVNAQSMRERIRARLTETHQEDWCYEFVWESWRARI